MADKTFKRKSKKYIRISYPTWDAYVLEDNEKGSTWKLRDFWGLCYILVNELRGLRAEEGYKGDSVFDPENGTEHLIWQTKQGAYDTRKGHLPSMEALKWKAECVEYIGASITFLLVRPSADIGAYDIKELEEKSDEKPIHKKYSINGTRMTESQIKQMAKDLGIKGNIEEMVSALRARKD